MTVASSTNSVDYTGNGSTTVFSFSFRIFAATDLVVTQADADGVETVLELNTDYTVTGVGSYSGGSITMATAPTSGYALNIRRVLPLTQDTDLRNQGQFFAETHEDVFDRLAMVGQQLQEQLDRSAKLPVTYDIEDIESFTADIVRLADSADSIDTLYANLADITTVADDLNEPVSEINTVAGAIDNVNAVGANIDNVNLVAAVDGDVTTVAGIEADVSTVSGIAANVTTVANVSSDVTTVAGISADVAAVSGNETDISAVAGASAEISLLAADLAGTGYDYDLGSIATPSTGAGTSPASSINTVATNIADVQAVAADATDIGTVATNIADINAVAAIDSDVSTVADNIADINTAATNIAAIIAAPDEAASAASSAAAAAASASAASAIIASGMYSAVQDKSTDYTVVSGDAGDLIRVTSTSGAKTITLPSISSVTDGFKVAVVKWTGDANAVTVARSSADTINGQATYVLANQYNSATFVADAETSQWFAAGTGVGGTNVVIDQFSGDGSTTVFTLSGDAGSENNTQVFVGGVYQQKDTYSLSGTTLTFSAAPPSGSTNIEVVWTQPLAVGVPSDNTVSTAKLQNGAVTVDKLASTIDLGAL